MKTLCLKNRDQDGLAREYELAAITAELFKQCLECEGWRQRAELFVDQRFGRHLFQTAWTWGAAHIIDQCSRGKLIILGSDSQPGKN
jgi:hypothetical protein